MYPTDRRQTASLLNAPPRGRGIMTLSDCERRNARCQQVDLRNYARTGTTKFSTMCRGVTYFKHDVKTFFTYFIQGPFLRFLAFFLYFANVFLLFLKTFICMSSLNIFHPSFIWSALRTVCKMSCVRKVRQTRQC